MVRVSSFGVRRPDGVPVADAVLDCRALFDPMGRRLGRLGCGRHPLIAARVLASEGASELLNRAFAAVEGGAQSVAFGCQWGVHRSVALTEELVVRLQAAGYEVEVEH